MTVVRVEGRTDVAAMLRALASSVEEGEAELGGRTPRFAPELAAAIEMSESDDVRLIFVHLFLDGDGGKVSTRPLGVEQELTHPGG